MLFRSPIVRFFSRILNRVTITVVLVALQLLWLCWVAFAITTGTGRVWVNGLLNALSLLIVLYLVRKDENSAYKVGWIALIGILPLLGGALYLAFGNKRPAKRLRLKMQAVEDAHKKDLVQEPGVLEGLDAREQGQSRYVAKYGPYPAWQNTRTQYFACGEAMYPQLLADLEKAEKSIFLEFFIVSHGCMWNGVEKILRRKAAQGVDVRLIYDDFGSLLGLPADFIVRMERAHIRCIPFNPVVPLLSLVMNHRDHRKIVVIDGTVAYTGGVNLADEYINAEQRFGYWKDAALRVEGDAAWNFTVMFLNFWNAFRSSETDYDAFRHAAGAAGIGRHRAALRGQPTGRGTDGRDGVPEHPCAGTAVCLYLHALPCRGRGNAGRTEKRGQARGGYPAGAAGHPGQKAGVPAEPVVLSAAFEGRCTHLRIYARLSACQVLGKRRCNCRSGQHQHGLPQPVPTL